MYARIKNALEARPFPPRAEEGLVTKLQEDELIQSAFRNWIAKRERKAETETAKPEGTKGAGETPKAEATKKTGEIPKVGNPLQDPLHHLAESLYFSQHPFEAVAVEHLARSSMRIDSDLAAGDARPAPLDARRRRRLTMTSIDRFTRRGHEIPLPPRARPGRGLALKPAPAAKPATTTPRSRRA